MEKKCAQQYRNKGNRIANVWYFPRFYHDCGSLFTLSLLFCVAYFSTTFAENLYLMAVFILADNQELSSYAIEHLLTSMKEKIVYSAPDKAELVYRLKSNTSSIIILDYTLFDFTDVENLLIISERFPQSSWVLLSEELTEPFLKTVIYRSRNMSVVFKDSPLKEIKEAVAYALRGERYICQRVTEILLAQQQKEDEIPSKLTLTEIEIVRAIAQGKTTKEIAAERFSSIHTINTHRKNIFRKLSVNTAHEAVKAAVKSGLIDTSEYYI